MTRRDSEDSRPTVIAHRGFAGISPENTVRAARRAATGPGRAAMVELDVMPTRDGTVVCFHDSHLHATETSRGLTDAQGTVWETPDDTVLTAEVLRSGQTVPRLADVLDALPTDVCVNVELKNPGVEAEGLRFDEALGPDALATQREVWTPFVAAVVDVIAQYEHDVLFSSFYEAALAAAREVAPSVPVGVLTSKSPSDCRTIADRYDAEAIHPPRTLVLDDQSSGEVGRPDAPTTTTTATTNTTGMTGTAATTGTTNTTDVVADARDAGRAVNVWTVNTWYQAERLRRIGVDGIIAEYPFLLQPTDEGDDSSEFPPTG